MYLPNKENGVDTISLDFSEVFDMVSCGALLIKLERMEISKFIKLIRWDWIALNKELSGCKEVINGVSQSFNIFILDHRTKKWESTD